MMPSVSKGSHRVKAAGATSLEQDLKDRNTAIIGDTLHFETLSVHDFDGTIIDPSSIAQVIKSTNVFYHVWAAVKQTIDERHTRGIPESALTKASLERFLFELGNVILDRVAGPHLTFVDPRRHNNKLGIMRNAQRLVSLFEEKGIHRSQVAVSIPATQAGVEAAKELQETHGIKTNLCLVTGLIHAAACAEAGATTITIAVGRLLDWHERKRKKIFKDLMIHPGIEAIQSTLAYFRLHGIKTKVIGSGFRSLTEIGPLGDFDAICVTKDQADRMKWSQVGLSTPVDSSSVALRARQAQHPTRLLESEGGFMNVMSAETRNMVSATMYVALGEMKAHMDVLHQIVENEVVRQFELQILDLRTLYSSSKRRQGIKHRSATCKHERSLADSLGLDDATDEDLGEDEVF